MPPIPFQGDFLGYEGFDLAGNQAFSLIEDETLGTLTLRVVTDAEAVEFIA